MRTDIYPVIKKTAKEAGIAAAKEYVNSKKGVLGELIIQIEISTKMYKPFLIGLN